MAKIQEYPRLFFGRLDNMAVAGFVGGADVHFTRISSSPMTGQPAKMRVSKLCWEICVIPVFQAAL